MVVGTKVRTQGGVGKERLPHPRGQLDGLPGRMHADALEDIDQVGVEIHRVQPARHQQTLDDADALRADLGRSKEPIAFLITLESKLYLV